MATIPKTVFRGPFRYFFPIVLPLSSRLLLIGFFWGSALSLEVPHKRVVGGQVGFINTTQSTPRRSRQSWPGGGLWSTAALVGDGPADPVTMAAATHSDSLLKPAEVYFQSKAHSSGHIDT